MISDKGSQFAADLIRELNQMPDIQTRLSTAFYPQMNRQIEYMNQKLKQYLEFFVNHKLKNQPKWLVVAKFTANSKVYTATKVSPFIASYGRELQMRANIRRKGNVEMATEFVERIRKIQQETGVALKKAQEKMKQQANKRQKEIKAWKKSNKVILSTKD